MAIVAFMAVGAVVGGVMAHQNSSAAAKAREINYNNQVFQQNLSADAEARQHAQINAVRHARNVSIAEQSLATQTRQESLLGYSTGQQLQNMSRAHQYQRDGMLARAASKGSRGGTRKAMGIMLQQKMLEGHKATAVANDVARRNLEIARENALRTRSTKFDEIGVQMPGIRPVGASLNDALGGAISGAQTFGAFAQGLQGFQNAKAAAPPVAATGPDPAGIPGSGVMGPHSFLQY